MSEKCMLKVDLDDSIKNNNFFKQITEVEFDKMDIFKYGILNEAVPPKIKENEFDYLEGKIPFLFGLYQDFIELDTNRIFNLSEEENSKRISETIGVGVGLLYATKLLKINPNAIQRIKASKKKKYLDFKVLTQSKQYEIETKGTINHSKKSTLLKDIFAKKKDSTTKAVKCGVITLANKANNKAPSKLIVCDDWEEKSVDTDMDFKDYFYYYAFFLSFIMDSTFYNRMYHKMENCDSVKNLINIKSIPFCYMYNGRKFLGQYFDKRLVIQLVKENYYEGMNIELLYELMTEKVGINQIFLGIDYEMIKCLNSGNVDEVKKYSIEKSFVVEKETEVLMCDVDGVLIVASKGENHQFKNDFTDTVVKTRMTYILNYITNTPHECGGVCRSREKEGELCKKLTYRERCHFHREE